MNKPLPKAKVWYKYIKSGDRVLVKLHPKHSWYDNVGETELAVTITATYGDGVVVGTTEVSLSQFVEVYNINMGWGEGDWGDYYPVYIIKKLPALKN